jgi:GrpB-like predicted nucleotidyltransferase (UPF0157 family)
VTLFGVAEWPSWAREHVELHPPDKAWRERGVQAGRLLEAALAAWLVAPVEHVGSTAVPGLPAKPILDLQAAVADLACASRVAATLAPAGWQYVPPELDARPWRRFFVQIADGHRIAHLHLMTRSSPRWDEQVVFRDALRADPALAQRYATLKRSLAARYADDREAYTAAKGNFIRAVLQQQR